jgi:prepilin-type N-terminal cleavage/methylation domain-containing protein/prepilin-type processing-associated H-X9-DG protein
MSTALKDSMVTETHRDIRGERGSDRFTLIELLVVIAVISLLLAILMPVLSRVRVIAERVVCRSNLKQIAVAWQMYLDDYGGRFYQGWNSDVDYGGWKGTAVPVGPRPLNKYVSLPPTVTSERKAKVFRCPSDKGGVLPAYSLYGTSYRTNHLLIGPDRIGWLPDRQLRNEINKRLPRLNRSDVGSPSRLILIGDYGWVDQWWPDPDWGLRLEWHGRCCEYNVAFFDGHAAFMKIHKGLYVTDDYCVLPFSEVYELALEVQEKIPCPLCE